MTLTILPDPSTGSSREARPPHNRAAVVVAAFTALAVVLGAVYWFGFRDNSAGSPVKPTSRAAAAAPSRVHLSAAAMLSSSLKAAASQRSVHTESTMTGFGHHLRYVDDSGRADGIQRVTVDGGTAVVRVIGRTTYFTATDGTLRAYFGLGASEVARYHGRWVRLVRGDRAYDSVTEAVTLASALRQVLVQSPLTLLPERTVDGVSAVGVRGRVTGPDVPKGGVTATLWMSSTAPYLPVEYDAVGSRLQQTARFSRWNEPVTIVAPTKWTTPVDSRSSAPLLTEQDASVRSDLRNMATLEETYFTDNAVYAGAAKLRAGFSPRLTPGEQVVIHLDPSKGYCLAGHIGSSSWWIYASEAGGSSGPTATDTCSRAIYPTAGGTLP